MTTKRRPKHKVQGIGQRSPVVIDPLVPLHPAQVSAQNLSALASAMVVQCIDDLELFAKSCVMRKITCMTSLRKAMKPVYGPSGRAHSPTIRDHYNHALTAWWWMTASSDDSYQAGLLEWIDITQEQLAKFTWHKFGHISKYIAYGGASEQ